MARHLNVLLFLVEPPGRPLYYSEVVRGDPEGVDDGGPARGASRVGRWLRGARVRWQRSQGGAAKAGRKVWDWLHARTHPDEVLYARLRNARLIEMRHPAAMTDADVTRAWGQFLTAGQWRHTPWLLVNLVLAPAALLLALLPGPNLIGYWFAYRAVHHALILVGLYRARSGRVFTRLVAVAALDRPIETDADSAAVAARLAAMGLAKSPQKLGDFLRRQGVTGAPAVLAGPDAPAEE